jgi:hypothetical protein
LADQLMFWASRKLGQLAQFAGSRIGNASVIGGRVAIKLFPKFLKIARKQIKFPLIFVMGSNGKTTTAKYLVDLAQAQGEVVLNNGAGSNMTTGIAALVIRSWKGITQGSFTLGVFEIDEAYAESIASDLQPEHALVLNVQIDQIYRLHEPERVSEMFSETLKLVTKTVIVNGNDNMLVTAVKSLESKVNVQYFGLAGASFTELGLYRPVELMSGSNVLAVSKSGQSYSISRQLQTFALQAPSPGVHFALNGAAAIAVAEVAISSKPSLEVLADELTKSKPAFGRGEIVNSGNAKFDLILFKNRPSLQININAESDSPTTTVLAFDEYSQDPSWLFAIDYSPLGKVDFVSGEKADFLELALEYAGITVGERNENIRAVVESIDKKYKDSSTPSFHRMYLDYDQMMATRAYFGLKMGKAS